MNMNRLQRVVLGIIVITSLYASIQNLIGTKELGNLHDDPVLVWENRFEPIKRRLPFTRGVVGYISDSSIPGVDFDAANDEGEYILTQYVMAPIIIVKGTDQEWNIGNLGKQAYEVWSRSNHGQFEVTPFKGNIYLIHRVGK